MYSLPLRRKVDKFSLPLFPLRRGARYSLFDKSTSISSLREHQLQDSSWDINLLSGRNVISQAIDTLVADTNNTKTIAGSSLIKKKKGERVCVQAAFGSNAKVRIWRLVKHVIYYQRIRAVPDFNRTFFQLYELLNHFFYVKYIEVSIILQITSDWRKR